MEKYGMSEQFERLSEKAHLYKQYAQRTVSANRRILSTARASVGGTPLR